MARTTIVAFRQDPQGEWIADLACGHSQHVRHRPPWQVRPWVERETGRAAKLNTEIDCPVCSTPPTPPTPGRIRR